MEESYGFARMGCHCVDMAHLPFTYEVTKMFFPQARRSVSSRVVVIGRWYKGWLQKGPSVQLGKCIQLRACPSSGCRARQALSIKMLTQARPPSETGGWEGKAPARMRKPMCSHMAVRVHVQSARPGARARAQSARPGARALHVRRHIRTFLLTRACA